MASVVDKLFSIRSDIQLRVLAIVVLAGIALIMCYPLVANPNLQINAAQVTVITLSIFGIIIIILADRIVSLNISKNKLSITLSELKNNVKETIEYMREDLQEASPPPDVTPTSQAEHQEQQKKIEKKIEDVETVVLKGKSGKSVEELMEGAKDMGEVMGMLREIMKSYRAFNK